MKRRACVHCVSALLACVILSGCIEKPAGETETIMLPGDVPLVMVWMPEGSFTMGSPETELDRFTEEGPQHTVKFSAGFWMGKYELTKRQWQAVMGTTPWEGQQGVLTYPESPAVFVTWNDAKDFVGALNALTGKSFRLPTEAEWEYACRAGTTTRFYWGDDPSYADINDYAWWDGNASSAGQAYAHVVGLKLPNGWGLHDMTGNVYEWCEDDSFSGYSGAPTDGQAWVDSPHGVVPVIRGGTWDEDVHFFRSAFRNASNAAHANSYIGFRLSR